MDGSGPTWIVMVRDVSHTVRIRNHSRAAVCLVLDADTGLARGISAAATSGAACAEAMHMALASPAGPLPPDAPARVLCTSGHAAAVRAEFRRLLAGAATPVVAERTSLGEAEDIFDSFVGHMAGRRQPEQFPAPADWQALYDQLGAYCQGQPWLRRSDTDQLDLVVTVEGAAARYVAVVIGQVGIQRGLVLYPGAVLPEALGHWAPGDPLSVPAGTLLVWLDSRDEVPAEFVAKAVRYGWPDPADLFPVPLAGGPDGPADLDRRDAHHLTLGVAGILAHDLRGSGGGGGFARTTGELPLAEGRCGRYRIG